MRFFPGILLIIVSLSGCASLTEEECGAGDWLTIGSQDAQQGFTPSRLNDHAKACKRFNIQPDNGQYQEGYKRGLVFYCTAENGFRVGRNGYAYRNICPQDAEPVFLSGFDRGRLLHDVESQIAEAETSLLEVERQIGETYASREKDKQESLFRLDAEKDRLKREIERLERQRDRSLIMADRFLQSVSPQL